MNPGVDKLRGELVALAREARGLSQAELADRMGMSQAQVSKVENGWPAPPGFERCAAALRMPLTFFQVSDPVLGPGLSEYFHRKRRATGMKLLRTVYAQNSIQSLHVAWLLRSVEVPVSIPKFNLEDMGSPQQAAAALRALWRLPAGPIRSVVSCIEAAGGIVLERPMGSISAGGLDGLSQPISGMPPLFFINSEAPASRRRWTLAHELGHVVLHETPSDGAEQEADDFAGAFLAPPAELRADLLMQPISLPRLVELKAKWGMSMAALARRARQLEAIDQSAYTHIFIRLGKEGWRRREPGEGDIPPERPMAMRNLLDLHRTQLGYSDEALARLLHLSVDDLYQEYLGPRMTLVVKNPLRLVE